MDPSDVADLLTGRRWLVLTGAGMSTDSGIPDYRGPDQKRRIEPMTIQEFRGSAGARQRYWARSFIGWRNFASARPNAGHLAVTDLQRAGVTGPIITQNVDGLHQAAGSRDVVELHGSLARVICLSCGADLPRTELDARIADANPDFHPTTSEIRPDGDVSLQQIDVDRFVSPRCWRCGEDQLKPDVVFFGEGVVRPIVDHCYQLVADAEALLVLGSSLTVMSGLRFVRRAVARELPVVVWTVGSTRADELGVRRVDAPLSPGLTAVAELLQS